MGALLALLLGLGVPRSFPLLYALLLGLAWLGRRSQGPGPSRLLRWSSLGLLLFGVTYCVMQVGWGVWAPAQAHLGAIMAVVVLPSGGLLAGWYLPRLDSRQLSRWLVVYALGGLVYGLLALALSRTPWWNIGQVFELNVRVPWGSQSMMNMRSVEQRVFPALALFPVACPLLWLWLRNRRGLLWPIVMLLMSALAAHAAWAFQGRIGVVILAVAALPMLWLLPSATWRLWIVSGGTLFVSMLLASGRACDERWWLQIGFLQRLGEAPWGGRLLDYTYRDCLPGRINHFGVGATANTSSPHNLILDIYNDAGWLPTVCLLLAILPVAWVLLKSFWRAFSTDGWNAPLALRWSFVSVLLVEWLLQPFLYADQLMASLGFLLAGAMLSEFSSDNPRG